MNSLPDQILKYHIADYLSPSDACQLINTSKDIQSRLGLCATPPRKILDEFSRAECRHSNDDRGPFSLEYGFEIPVPSQVACHSVSVFMGRDRGWCHRKSLLVIATGDDEEAPERPGRVVSSSVTAPHAPERLELTIRPERGRSYHLWYVVGGGNGGGQRVLSVLTLRDVTVQALAFDDPSRSYATTRRFLDERGSFPPWDVVARTPFPERVRPPAPLPSEVAEAGLPRTPAAPMDLVDAMLTEFDREVRRYERGAIRNFDVRHPLWARRTTMEEELHRWEVDDAEHQWNPGLEREGCAPARHRRKRIFYRIVTWGQRTKNFRLKRRFLGVSNHRDGWVSTKAR